MWSGIWPLSSLQGPVGNQAPGLPICTSKSSPRKTSQVPKVLPTPLNGELHFLILGGPLLGSRDSGCCNLGVQLSYLQPALTTTPGGRLIWQGTVSMFTPVPFTPVAPHPAPQWVPHRQHRQLSPCPQGGSVAKCTDLPRLCGSPTHCLALHWDHAGALGSRCWLLIPTAYTFDGATSAP